MAEGKKTIEEVIANYAASQEGAGVNAPVSKVSPAKKVQDNFAKQAQSAVESRQTLAEAQAEHQQNIKEELIEKKLGFLEVPVEDLPTGGIFYPDGTKVFVRAASGGDIRHWSMFDDSRLEYIDEALNYVIERCVSISNKDFPMTWKDIKEIDRFYLILTVRDFTFTEGHNELKIDISENDQITVKKDNISFIDIDEKLMKYYNKDKKCFTFRAKTPSVGEINFYIPSIGVSNWIMNYARSKANAQQPFDTDFIKIAPMLINDYRKLNERTYSDLIQQSMSYGVYEWSLIVKVRKALEKAVTPKMTYQDESGVEQETPLNFHGGIKSIFNIDLDEELDL